MHKRGEEASAGSVEWMETIVGVICDRRITARVKGKVYKMAVRPVMMYGLKTAAVTKKTGGRAGGGRDFVLLGLEMSRSDGQLS